MARLLDSWDAAKLAPGPVEVARRSAVDVLLAGEEFRGAAEQVREGASLGDSSGRDLGKFLGGVGAGLATAGTFVFPWGRGGSLALGVGRGVAGRAGRAGALRSAAGLGDEAAEGLAGGVARQTGLSESGDAAAIRLADEIAARLTAGDVPAPTSGRVTAELPARSGETFALREQVSTEDFDRALDFVRPMRVTREGQPFRTVEETVYRYPSSQYDDMRLFLSDDGLSGFAIKSDGDLVSVFSAPGLGRGEALVDAAIARNATKLDAFDESGFLPRLYGSRGFVEVGRVPWDPQEAPSVWRGGTPDVVFMELRKGKSSRR